MTRKVKAGCRTWLLLGLAFIGSAWSADTTPPSDPRLRLRLRLRLRQELLDLTSADQEGRTSSTITANRLREIDATNTARLKQIVAERGWPTKAMVGEDGASAAWLLAQHADADPDFQQSVLARMKELLPTGEAKASQYAYLFDRTHRPQRYGTQGECVGPGKWMAREIENSERVDERRASMAIDPPRLAQYIELMSKFCK